MALDIKSSGGFSLKDIDLAAANRQLADMHAAFGGKLDTSALTRLLEHSPGELASALACILGVTMTVSRGQDPMYSGTLYSEGTRYFTYLYDLAGNSILSTVPDHDHMMVKNVSSFCEEVLLKHSSIGFIRKYIPHLDFVTCMLSGLLAIMMTKLCKSIMPSMNGLDNGINLMFSCPHFSTIEELALWTEMHSCGDYGIWQTAYDFPPSHV